MPLQFGLSGKFDEGVSFPANDHRKNRLTPAIIEAANVALKPAWQLCGKYRINKTELSLSYILSYPEVSIVIPGIRTASHAEKNVSGLIQLSIDERGLIGKLGPGPLTLRVDRVQKQG